MSKENTTISSVLKKFRENYGGAIADQVEEFFRSSCIELLEQLRMEEQASGTYCGNDFCYNDAVQENNQKIDALKTLL